MSKPSGVGSFSHKPSGSKGKKYPSGVNKGQAGVQIKSGTSPSGEFPPTSGSNSTPSGVKCNSGKENYRANPRYFGSKTKGYAKQKLTDSSYPSGVARHSGK